MKIYILTLLTFFFLSATAQEYKRMIDAGTYTLSEIQTSAEIYFNKKGNGKGTGYKQFKRWEYEAEREVDENGFLPSRQAQLTSYKKFKARQVKSRTTQEQADWTDLGPTYWNRTSGWNPGVGRITSIAVDENNYNHIIIGSHSGGVWRTTDKGANWTPLCDEETNLFVYSVAIDPQDSKTYYWGSTNGRIYKSTNSGTTWSQIATVGYNDVNRILIHPTNSNIMFASGTYSGFYKSTDGGQNWNKVSNSSRGYDLEFKPGDPNTVYASGTSFYKSTDGGDNFTQITGTSTGVKLIGISPADPNKVYVLEENSSKFGGLYVSNNSGTSLTKIDHGTDNYFGFSATASDTKGQAPRDMAIAVNPTNADEVHIASLMTWRSLDGGTTFELTSHWTHGNAARYGVGYCHSDVDIMQFHGNTLYIGTDGGIYISENPSKEIDADYFDDLSTGLGIRQFYRFGISQTDPVIITGGSQDNGTSVWYQDTDEWYDWLGADGMETFVDWSDPTHLYGTSQNGSMYESTNGGTSYKGISKPSGKTGSWVTPFEQDPVNSNTLYVGMDKVYKKVGTGSWTAISQEFSGNLTQLKIAPSDNNIMYAAKGWDFFKTTTGSGTWTEISGLSGSINTIAIHPNDPNKVAVGTSSGNRVYMTTDGGQTWTSYKKNLPNMTAYTLVWDHESNNGLYLGMAYGIYYINDDLTDWVLYADNVPNVKINELAINHVTNKIYAATWGRGLWQASLYGQATKLALDLKTTEFTGTDIDQCGLTISPKVTVKNNGTDEITRFVSRIYIDNVEVKKIITNNISLLENETIDVDFGTITSTSGTKEVKVTITKPNRLNDEDESNNEEIVTTTFVSGSLHTFFIDKTSENKDLDFIIKNEANDVILIKEEATNTSNNEQTEYNFCLDEGCYSISVTNAFNTNICNEEPWNENTIYLGDYGNGGEGTGEIVSYNGKIYRALWWTSGITTIPGTVSNWKDLGECASSIDTDEFGIKDLQTTLFATKVENYTSPTTVDFCTTNYVDVEINVDKNTTLNCDDVTFSATIQGNGTTYSWNFGEGATPQTANGIGPHTVSYLTTGKKTVSLNVDGLSFNEVDLVNVMQNQTLIPSVEIDITKGNNPTCIDEDIEFTATTEFGGNSPTYEWTINGASTNETSNIFLVKDYINNDIVKCHIISNLDCAVTTNASSNSITLIRDLCTGTENDLENHVSVYPNPTTNSLTIESTSNMKISWTIFNNHGKVLNLGSINDDTKKLDLSTYAQGVYFIQIVTKGQSSVIEVIKE